MVDIFAWFDAHDYLRENLTIAAMLIVALLTYIVASKYILLIVTKMAKHTKTQIDDIIIKHKVLKRFALLAPALVIYSSAALFGGYQAEVERIMVVVIAAAVLYSLGALLNAAEDLLRGSKLAENIPLHNYVHLARIFIYVIGVVLLISIWTGKSPGLLLTGIGAMMAVVLLIFKDTILSLVASVQISTKDLLREGDWLEMPAYGADGDVVEISLHTVRVRNWDKTFTAIPTHKLLEEPFKNWRGMEESGGRRIKRALDIDLSTVKFLDEQTLERFRKYQLISDYIDTKLKEVEAYNREHEYDTNQLVNGRRLTNLGTFRAYVEAYLNNNPLIHKQMTFLVRQLAPGPEGIPLEIYVFTTDTRWAHYEAIQADIFDHLLAVVPLFDLKIYQNPAGSDFQKLADPALRAELEAGSAKAG